MLRIFGFAACLVLAGAVQAQEIRGLYLGGGYGFMSYDDVLDDQVPISDSASAYRLFGGFQFNENYALELGWTKSGGLSEDFSPILNIDIEFEAVTLRALALAPFGSLAMFGGIGYYDGTSRTDVVFNPEFFEDAPFSIKDDDGGFTAVGGIQFEMSRLSVRGEYEWFDTDGNVDVASLTIGVLFRF
ncbi:MAG: outer membrane beta-barrel protein [Gammaproteobacteria bacterium]|nr:hypothetical protein [Gammaproteobacteria bacterium]